ncbi:MAG: response regulator [Myxococcaceae bacterium]
MSTLLPKTPAERPTVLCVDDEPQVLLGLGLHLRRHYDFASFTTPAEALHRIEQAPVAVLISDMRMPGMNGAELLAKARQISPDTTRVLLTGHADLESAISAVNDGQIFRLLTKPCPPDSLLTTVRSAVEQNRLITSERVLLHQTVRGAIAALVDVLTMASPITFGRARRIKAVVQGMAKAAGIAEPWALELAAELCNLGYVSLPEELVAKLYKGADLTAAERAMAAKVPAATHQLLHRIPRLEPVWAILDELSQDPYKRSLPARLLSAATDFDDVTLTGATPDEAIEDLRRSDLHDAKVLDALAAAVGANSQGLTVAEVPLSKLAPGQLLAGDIHGTNGSLLMVRGTPITPALLERLRHVAEGAGVQEPLRIWEHGTP